MSDTTESGVSRPLPRVHIERPSADRGIPGVREHLDGPRCVFCGVLADRVETVDKFGHPYREYTCGGCFDSLNASFWHLSEDADRWRHCPRCGHPVRMYFDTDRCTGCAHLEREGSIDDLWYLSNEHLEAIVDAGEELLEPHP